MHPGIILLVFSVIFIAELPDKSLFASLILGTRFPAFYVWAGAAAAFSVHVLIAVTAGKLLSLLPHQTLEVVVGLVFLAGTLLVLLGKHGGEAIAASRQQSKADSQAWKVFSLAFGVVFLGEWGDITQIATANYAANYHDPWSVAIGAILALWTVAALAVTLGVKFLSLVPPRLLQTITACVLLLFAAFSFFAAFRS